jgi:hypothetical protein
MSQAQIAAVRYELHEQNVAPAFDGVGVGPVKSMFQDPGTYDLIDALYAHYWTNEWLKNAKRSSDCTSRSQTDAKDKDGGVTAIAVVCLAGKATAGVSWKTKVSGDWRWLSEETLRSFGYSLTERGVADYEADEDGRDGNFGPNLYPLSDAGTFIILDDVFTHQKTAEKLKTTSELIRNIRVPNGIQFDAAPVGG